MNITNVSFVDDLIYKHLHQSYLNDVHHQFQVVQQLPNINKINSIKQKNGIINFIMNLNSLGIESLVSSENVIYSSHKFIVLFEIPKIDYIDDDNIKYLIDTIHDDDDDDQLYLLIKHHKYIKHMFKKLNINISDDHVGIISEYDDDSDDDSDSDY